MELVKGGRPPKKLDDKQIAQVEAPITSAAFIWGTITAEATSNNVLSNIFVWFGMLIL
jgi:hypothetical protein